MKRDRTSSDILDYVNLPTDREGLPWCRGEYILGLNGQDEPRSMAILFIFGQS